MFAISPYGELLSGTQSRQSSLADKVHHKPPIGHLWGLSWAMFAISPYGELPSGTRSRQSSRADKVPYMPSSGTFMGRGRDSQAELLSASQTPDWALMGAGWGYVRNITLR
jgi:hypothetical protein